MTFRIVRRAALVTSLGFLLVACDGSSSPTAPVITAPPPAETVTEMFSGSLELGTTSCHGFSQVALGDVRLTITSLMPLETLTIGMGIGRPDEAVETGCALFASDNSVRLNEVLTSNGNDVGDYCVCLFDVGNIFADQVVSYTVDVEHT